MRAPRLHLVTNDEVLRRPAFQDHARALLRVYGPAIALHLRGHGLGGGALFFLADRLREIAEAKGSWLVVNDRVDVARVAGIRAVQLGRRSLPVPEARRVLGGGVHIGFSAHGAGEAAEAVAAGADFVIVGTIYPSASHPGDPGAGPAQVSETVAAVGAAVPVIAIGGVTPARVAPIMAVGGHGVAVLGGVWDAPDPIGAVREYLDALEEAVR